MEVMESDWVPYTTGSSGSTPPAGKVAIPFVPKIRRERRQRASRACMKCRERKCKCDGEQPACSHCRNSNVECVYDDPKRVREQRQLDLLPKKIEDYERLLATIIAGVDQSTANWIRQEASVSILLCRISVFFFFFFFPFSAANYDVNR